ncbi:hypothetical protein I3843_01G079600 [Carya illinoinensis]|nr:hypothetical protein I3843_01G079600 [Carya illinoinensis]
MWKKPSALDWIYAPGLTFLLHKLYYFLSFLPLNISLVYSLSSRNSPFPVSFLSFSGKHFLFFDPLLSVFFLLQPTRPLHLLDSPTRKASVSLSIGHLPSLKPEKERERKRKSMEDKDGEIKIALAQMTGDRATSMEERRQGVLKADRERAATFELKKKKFKAKMMLLDLSNLNAMQQEYFGAIQLQIFEEWRSHSGGTSTSPSTPYGSV